MYRTIHVTKDILLKRFSDIFLDSNTSEARDTAEFYGVMVWSPNKTCSSLEELRGIR